MFSFFSRARSDCRLGCRPNVKSMCRPSLFSTRSCHHNHGPYCSNRVSLLKIVRVGDVSLNSLDTTSNARKTSLTCLRFFLATETILLIETKNENATDICASNIIRITAMKFRFENGWLKKPSIQERTRKILECINLLLKIATLWTPKT